jgi:hypothetical protein
VLWFLDAGDDETIGTLSWAASKKRQGTKSREVGHWLSSEGYEDLMPAPMSMMDGTPGRCQRHIRTNARSGECLARSHIFN